MFDTEPCFITEGAFDALSFLEIGCNAVALNSTSNVRKLLDEIKAQTGNKDYFIADTTKIGKPRTIKPPAIAFDYLIDEQSKQISNRLRAGKAWSNPHNLVFTDEIGGHYAVGTFYKRFKRIAESIGRPDARPHDLRHSCATVALASGADIKSVQSLLGHATASFTLDVYGHTSEKMMQDTANRMQNYYNTLANNG